MNPSRRKRTIARHPTRSRAPRAEQLECRALLSAFPVGPELLVNTYTGSWQLSPAVAMRGDGSFVVAWTSYPQDGDAGIFAQRYSAAGTPVGAEFQVNTYTPRWQRNPTVAMDAQGRFLIAWYSDRLDGVRGIYAQRYHADGSRDGGEFPVNTQTFGLQPVAAMAPDGRAVITWAAGEIYGQRYDAVGASIGEAFRVNELTEGHQGAPAVAFDDDGELVVAWETGSTYDAPRDVVARRFDAQGAPLGGDFTVNSLTTGWQADASVAADAVGNFVIAWSSGGEVHTRRFDSFGAPQGNEFVVSSASAVEPQVAMDDDGDFVVAWRQATGVAFNDHVYGRRYASNGMPLGSEFRATGRLAGDQGIAAAMDADGDFVVAWSHDPRPWENNVNYDVYAQRFRPVVPGQTGTVGDRAWSDVDGDGVQEAGEPNFAGVQVELVNDFGSFAGVTSTSADGTYAFSVPVDVPARLRFRLPTGLIATWPDRGTDDGADSDIDPMTGLTPVFTLANPGQTDPTIDAGFVLPASIAGVVFSDRNTNGVRDAGEPGVPSFVVFADRDGDGARDADEPFAVSLNNGSYVIGNVLPDVYAVTVADQDAWLEPPAHPVAVPVSSAVTGIDRPVRTSVADTSAAPAGPEFRVNTHTTGTQSGPIVTADAAGNFMVTWHAQAGAAGPGTYATRYNASGAPLGPDILLAQEGGSVAMEANGDFVLAFDRSVGSGFAAFARQFNALGVPKGPAFRVSTLTAGNGTGPSVAVRATGEFVVTWHAEDAAGSGVYARRFDASGSPEGNEFRVATGAFPDVAIDPDGDFAVAWMRANTSVEWDVFARRFDASGQPHGGEFRVNTFTPFSQTKAVVAMDGDGDLIVAWESSAQIGIMAQRYNAAGEPQGGEFRVNTITGADPRSPAVAANEDGSWVIAWERSSQAGTNNEVFAQRYNSAGVPQLGEFRVNTFTTDLQRRPAMAMDAGGNFLVAWDSRSQDGSGYGVYAQRYAVAPSVTASSFAYATAPHRINFTFDRDVAASLGADDLILENITTGQTIPAADLAVTYDHASETATFRYTGNAGRERIPGVLPDGRYRATLLGSGVSTPNGAAMTTDHLFEFRFLQADANDDGLVNLRDFQILADNFHERGHGFTGGNFNYDAEGLVGLADFNILASRFGGEPPAPAATSSLFVGEQRRGDSDDPLDGLLS